MCAKLVFAVNHRMVLSVLAGDHCLATESWVMNPRRTAAVLGASLAVATGLAFGPSTAFAAGPSRRGHRLQLRRHHPRGR